MWNDQRKGWLMLAWHIGFGSRSLRKLRQRFGADGKRAAACSRQDLIKIGVMEAAADKYIAWRNEIDVDAFVRRCDADGIRFILIDDPEYPSFLLHSSDPPQALFARGATIQLTRPVAVVGTRTMSHYGARVTKNLVRDISQAGCEIISGLALGVDATAHTAALDVNGTTIAVLAGGINDSAIYPRHNLNLAHRIIEHGGTVLSESPPGTESLKFLFPLRNRIIAGLATATIVTEAAESSGSLLTAKIALDENRDVFAVPGPITSEQSQGTNKLIKLGATPYTEPEDILSLFGKTTALKHVPLDITDEDREILEILDRPLPIDELIRALATTPAKISERLTLLELTGCIEQQLPQVYSRTPRGKSSLSSS